MEFAFNETRTTDDWAEWDGTNFEVTGESVEIAAEPLPTYVAPEPLVAKPPPGFEAIDLAVDNCGDPHVLTAEGEIYRYDRTTERLQRLPCTWQAAGSPTGISVTRETIYVASDQGVQAFSKHLLQTRWVVHEPFVSPVAIVATGETVLVLDGGAGTGNGFLLRLEPNSQTRRVVTDLGSPIDLGIDGEGQIHVLTTRDGTTEVVRFDADYSEVTSIPTNLDPTCLAVGDGGEIVLGTATGSKGEASLFRPVSGEERVEWLPGFDRPSSGLLLTGDRYSGQLFAIDTDTRQVFVLDAHRQRRLNPVTDRYDAQLVRRFDAGTTDTQWHRVTLDRQLGGPGTQIRLEYYATDDGSLQYGTGPVDLEAIDGIGATYAGRLRDAGVTDLADLLELSPEAVSSIVSIEVLDVPPAQTAQWIEAAEKQISEATDEGTPDAETPDPETLDVEAVDGIGPTYGSRLREAGIETLEDLIATVPNDLARKVSRELITVSTTRTEKWLRQARRHLSKHDDVRGKDWQSLSKPNPKDALLDAAEGRYLWVRIELVGDADSSPRVDSFRAYFPRQSYLRHLPAIYRENEQSAAFLEQFLSIFESIFDGVEEDIGAATRYLDADGVPSEYLSWLGDWLALEAGEAWPTPAKRELLRRAPDLFKKRGTREGLLEVLRIYLDHVEPASGRPQQTPTDRGGKETGQENAGAERGEDRVYVFEHSDLDCIDDPAVRACYEEIVPCPRCFIVFVRSFLDADVVETIDGIVASEQPAHATGRTVQLRPGIQLGGNSFLGINTALPEREFVLEQATLGKDTVVSEHEEHGQLGLKSRLGTDSTIS